MERPKIIIYAIPESRNTAIIGLGSDDENKSEMRLSYLKPLIR